MGIRSLSLWPLGFLWRPLGLDTRTLWRHSHLCAGAGGVDWRRRRGLGFSLSFSIGTAAAVGWFPLGPREPYFPSYQASQGYFTRVNNTNTVINNTTINNYYDYSRNPTNTADYQHQLREPECSERRDGGSARHLRQRPRWDQDARTVPPAQLSSTQVFGAPAIAPQRESVLGARADTASRAARPPANVLSRPVVARTAPPPAAVPFDRQQPALSQNPGRPLPTAGPADAPGCAASECSGSRRGYGPGKARSADGWRRSSARKN